MVQQHHLTIFFFFLNGRTDLTYLSLGRCVFFFFFLKPIMIQQYRYLT